MKHKRLALVIMSALLVESLSGCGNVGTLYNSNIQEQQYASVQEIMDYYAKSMKYGSISTRPAVKSENARFNTVPEESETYAKLQAALQEVTAEHQKNGNYKIPDGVHNYLKAFTDDMVLSGSTIRRAKEYGGYYYLTVSYNVTKNTSGSFKEQANYLGIDGIIIKDIYGVEDIDDSYLNTVIKKMNPYLEALEKAPLENYGVDDSWLAGRYNPEDEPVGETDSTESEGNESEEGDTGEGDTGEGDTGEGDTGDEGNVTNETGENTGDGTGDVQSPTENELPNAPGDEGTEDGGDTGSATNVAELNEMFLNSKGEEVPKTGANNIDRLAWDMKEINDYVGSSKEQIAFIPEITMVYNPAPVQGVLNGYGMFSQGKAGLGDFGFTQNEIDKPGSIVITYVFKQNILEPDELDYLMAYVNEYDSANESIKGGEFGGVLSDFLYSEENREQDAEIVKEQFTGPQLTVPTFLGNQLEMIIDEFDRAVNNKSVTALLDGDVIEDVGLGMKYAAYASNAEIVTFKSDIKRVVARKGNEYLLEIDRTVEDSPAGAGVVGHYRDTYFVVVRQDGMNFKYNDEFFVKRVTTQVPEVEAENTSVRRLVTLNLSGVVDSNTAKDITDNLVNKLATLGSEQNNEMLDLFNSDRNLLSEERYNYITTKVITQLQSKGYNPDTEWIIKPSEWISGEERQVEFTTKELIKFTQADKVIGGLYLESYYLVSKYGTDWKIDDIINITTKYIEAEEVSAYEQDVNSTVAVINEGLSE